ncbi:MAG: ATP-binding protein [Balneolaceae bacterium]|nr:ATP-binding protein [Balneolaceae bacterium]
MDNVSLKKLNAIFSAFPTALVILRADDPDFTVVEVNNAFLEMTGMERNTLLNNPFLETVNNYSEGRFEPNLGELSSAVKKVVTEKKLIETDIFEFKWDGTQDSAKKNIYLQFKCSPVKDEYGAIDSVLLVVDDVTGLLTDSEKRVSDTGKIKTRKELQNQSEDLEKKAAVNKAQYKSASEELDDFVYSVSHDLRAPLRRIDGFSQEILNEYADKLDETGAHYLNRIRQGAQDMGQLIDDLLKLSRISRKSVEREEIDLGNIAKSVFEELMELEPERNVDLKIDDDLIINADKGLIKAMLSNLISNALKFTSNREVAEIQIGSKMLDGDKVFYISDNGVGFDPSYKHKLFKAFSRLHSQNQFSGTGIGLATVKRIMTLHGGMVWAESPDENGAIFYLKF